jgi:hypothetical protein
LRIFSLIVAGLLGSLFVAAPALAKIDERDRQFPDLPGMKLVERAAAGDVFQSTTVKTGGEGGTGSARTRGKNVSAVKQAAPPDPAAISGLPGVGAVPVLKANLAPAGTRTKQMPMGLGALAALGTILSLGGYVLFRRALS